MDVEIQSWMHDILNAIQEIDTFIVDSRDDFNAYEKRPKDAKGCGTEYRDHR